jgi:hypothetical protein
MVLSPLHQTSSNQVGRSVGSGAITIVILCLHGGAGLQQQLDHLDVAVSRCPEQ